MFYSAIGYLLTLFMAFTIIPLIAFFLRMVLVMLFSRIYWGVAKDKSPASLLQFSIKLAQPVGFATAIFHGFAALWMGVVFFKGLGVKLDFFLPVMLIFTFVWFGLKKLQKPVTTTVEVDNKITTTNSQGEETTIIIDPEKEANNPMAHQDPVKLFNEQMKNQLKDQTKEFMHGNTIIGLIGKVTGVILAATSYILPYL